MGHLTHRISDYSWDKGLAIVNCSFDWKEDEIATIEFSSKKYFSLEDEDSDDDDNLIDFSELSSDSESKKSDNTTKHPFGNIAPTLLGKGQFFSSLYFVGDGLDFTAADIKFIDDSWIQYTVVIEKYPELNQDTQK